MKTIYLERFGIIQKEYIENDKSIREVAKILNISYQTLQAFLCRNNISKSKKDNKEKLYYPEYYKIVQEEYVKNNKSMKEVSKILGISMRQLHRYLNYNQITKSYGNNTYRNKKWLYQKYIVENLSSSEIAIICNNCCRSLICHWIKRHKIGIKPTNSRMKLRKKYTKEELLEYRIYRYHVRRLSDKNYISYHKTIDPDNFGRNRKYHLDHIYPIAKGFENNIDPKIIAHPFNLRMLKGKLNRKKYTIEEITKEELFDRYNKFKQGDDFLWQDK